MHDILMCTEHSSLNKNLTAEWTDIWYTNDLIRDQYDKFLMQERTNITQQFSEIHS